MDCASSALAVVSTHGVSTGWVSGFSVLADKRIPRGRVEGGGRCVGGVGWVGQMGEMGVCVGSVCPSKISVNWF